MSSIAAFISRGFLFPQSASSIIHMVRFVRGVLCFNQEASYLNSKTGGIRQIAIGGIEGRTGKPDGRDFFMIYSSVDSRESAITDHFDPLDPL